MNGKSKAFAEVVAIIVVAIWGMTFISTKKLLSAGLSPVKIFFIRFFIAYIGIALWQLFPVRGRTVGLLCKSWRDEVLCVLAGISGGSFYFWSENTALTFTQASNVSFIVCTTPLVTALLYSAFTGRTPKSRLIFGSALSLLGIALIAFHSIDDLKLGLKGDVLAMCASLTWSVYTIISNRLMKTNPPELITRKVFFYGMISIMPAVLLAGDFNYECILSDWEVIGNILFLSIVASLGCYAVWNIIIRKLGAVEASNYIYLNPVFTLIGSIAILGEKLTPLSALGCAMTLFGVWLADRTE